MAYLAPCDGVCTHFSLPLLLSSLAGAVPPLEGCTHQLMCESTLPNIKVRTLGLEADLLLSLFFGFLVWNRGILS